MKKILKIFSNKIFLYISSRYLTYFLQFISSIYIAVNLGPYYFGVYGFILLLISYLSTINFGITHSTTVLLVQSKTNEKEISKIVSNSILLIFFISLLVIILSFLFFFIDIDYFKKYNINSYILFVPIIAIIGHFNILFLTIYRFKNKLFEVAFQQSFRPFLVFISVFIAPKENLLYIILLTYLIGDFIPLLLFIFKRQLPFEFKFSLNACKKIIVKALYLFMYISSFGMILITTRTFISYYYSVADFGFFSFSFSLANAILLFLQALAFLFTPKILDKLNSNNNTETLLTIEKINSIYITFSYFLLFLAIVFFPFCLDFFPKWKASLPTINMSVISIMMISNSFTFSSFLMAKNKEKLLSLISILSLLINILVSFLLIRVFTVKMEYVILSTMISYFIFGLLSTYYVYKIISNYNFIKLFNCFLPVRLLIPYFVLIFSLSFNVSYASYISLLIFIILNFKELLSIIIYIKKAINNSSLIDL